MALALIAEQNIDAYYQVESLKKDLEAKFVMLKEHIDTKIEAIRKDVKIANAIHLDAIENVNKKSESLTESIHEKIKVVEQQVNEMHDSFGKGALLSFINDVPKVQNEIKQELFLIRNKSNSNRQEKSNKSPESRHKSYSDVVSKSKEKESRKNEHENRDDRKIHQRREKSLNRGYRSHENRDRHRNYSDRRYNLPHVRDRPQVFHHRNQYPQYRQNNWSRSRPLFRDYQSAERWPRRQNVYDHSYRYYDRNTVRETPYNAGFDIPVFNRFGPLGNF